jgi:hypothetical protein
MQLVGHELLARDLRGETPAPLLKFESQTRHRPEGFSLRGDGARTGKLR